MRSVIPVQTRIKPCILCPAKNSGMLVEWLKRRACDQHGLGSKPTCTVLLFLERDALRHFSLLGSLGEQC